MHLLQNLACKPNNHPSKDISPLKHPYTSKSAAEPHEKKEKTRQFTCVPFNWCSASSTNMKDVYVWFFSSYLLILFVYLSIGILHLRVTWKTCMYPFYFRLGWAQSKEGLARGCPFKQPTSEAWDSMVEIHFNRSNDGCSPSSTLMTLSMSASHAPSGPAW